MAVFQPRVQGLEDLLPAAAFGADQKDAPETTFVAGVACPQRLSKPGIIMIHRSLLPTRQRRLRLRAHGLLTDARMRAQGLRERVFIPAMRQRLGRVKQNLPARIRPPGDQRLGPAGNGHARV